MPKTTKKTVSTKKSVPKKTTAKSTTKKPIEKITSPAPKKTVSRKSAIAKSVPKIETIDTPTTSSPSSQNSAKEDVKVLGILHLVGNLLSGGTLGIILVVIYFLVKKDDLSELEKETCFEIINFNLSFIVYTFVAACMIFLIIGIVLFPLVLVVWLVLMIKGFFQHLEGKNYKYPNIIRFIS